MLLGLIGSHVVAPLSVKLSGLEKHDKPRFVHRGALRRSCIGRKLQRGAEAPPLARMLWLNRQDRSLEGDSVGVVILAYRFCAPTPLYDRISGGSPKPPIVRNDGPASRLMLTSQIDRGCVKTLG